MNYKAELYRKCHIELAELYNKNQTPLFTIDNEVENRLIQDGAIRRNDLSCIITSKGKDLFLNKHYLNLAEEAKNQEREKELRERDSFANQTSAEQAIEQTKINRRMFYCQIINIILSSIAALGTILCFF